MTKLLTTINLLCFSVAANAEVYVCSRALDDGSVFITTFTRTDAGFRAENPNFGGTELDFRIVDDTNTWLVLINTVIFSDFSKVIVGYG